jgi:hypothetical protein
VTLHPGRDKVGSACPTPAWRNHTGDDRTAGIVPLTFALSLYLIAFSRWGSYVGVPGLPIYIGDVVLALAIVQVAYLTRLQPSLLRRLTGSPTVLQLCTILFSVAAIRFALDPSTSLVALRDLAPYTYSLTALLAYLVPIGAEHRLRMPVLVLLTWHVSWTTVLPLAPGFPWHLPMLGGNAQLLTTRPDIDACILGATSALALSECLGAYSRRSKLAFVVLALLSFYGATSLGTRAGLLASLVMIASVGASHRQNVADVPRPIRSARQPRRKALAASAIIVLLSVLVVFSPAGGRVVEGFRLGTSQASGTVDARIQVWDRVADYIFRSAERTAVGVGFGRDFIDESGSRPVLEGGVYVNVRSPHNYILGTLARLGMAVAGLVAVIWIWATWLAVRTLRQQPRETVTTLAALLCIGVPITAMLGVVLEAPFGAIPYFWAVGHLSHRTMCKVSSTSKLAE